MSIIYYGDECTKGLKILIGLVYSQEGYKIESKDDFEKKRQEFIMNYQSKIFGTNSIDLLIEEYKKRKEHIDMVIIEDNNDMWEKWDINHEHIRVESLKAQRQLYEIDKDVATILLMYDLRKLNKVSKREFQRLGVVSFLDSDDFPALVEAVKNLKKIRNRGNSELDIILKTYLGVS